jgi:flagellar basal-body rod protein FlgF
MDNPGYVGLTRQSGLMREMQVVANNIANMATTGFRREGVVFAEHVAATGPETPACPWAMPSGAASRLCKARSP